MNSKFPAAWTTNCLGYLTRAQLSLIVDIVGANDRPVREFWRSLHRDPSCEYEHDDIIKCAQIVVDEIPEFLLANMEKNAKINVKNRKKFALFYFSSVQSVTVLTYQLEKLILAVKKELKNIEEGLRLAEKQGPDTGVVPEEDD